MARHLVTGGLVALATALAGGAASAQPADCAAPCQRMAQMSGNSNAATAPTDSGRPVMRPRTVAPTPGEPAAQTAMPDAPAATQPAPSPLVPGRPIPRAGRLTAPMATPPTGDTADPANPAATTVDPARIERPVWSQPIPSGCPAENVLIPGENRLSGQVRGDTICRMLIPDGTAANVTLVGPGRDLPDLRIVLYSRTTTVLTPDQPVAIPAGRQELRILRGQATPGRTALPFDLLIRLD